MLLREPRLAWNSDGEALTATDLLGGFCFQNPRLVGYDRSQDSFVWDALASAVTLHHSVSSPSSDTFYHTVALGDLHFWLIIGRMTMRDGCETASFFYGPTAEQQG
jgi:hypothetical protein